MPKLYEIANEMQTIEDWYNEMIDPDTGEMRESETLEAVDNEFEEMLKNKSAGIIKFYLNENSSINSLNNEIERLKKLKETKEKQLKWYMKYIEDNMKRMSKKEIETELGKIRLKKSITTEVDEKKIKFDSRYTTTETQIINKYSKKAIKELIEAGEKIEGAYLKENYKVEIK